MASGDPELGCPSSSSSDGGAAMGRSVAAPRTTFEQNYTRALGRSSFTGTPGEVCRSPASALHARFFPPRRSARSTALATWCSAAGAQRRAVVRRAGDARAFRLHRTAKCRLAACRRTLHTSHPIVLAQGARRMRARAQSAPAVPHAWRARRRGTACRRSLPARAVAGRAVVSRVGCVHRCAVAGTRVSRIEPRERASRPIRLRALLNAPFKHTFH